jgi:hypothetical protein
MNHEHSCHCIQEGSNINIFTFVEVHQDREHQEHTYTKTKGEFVFAATKDTIHNGETQMALRRESGGAYFKIWAGVK